MNANIKTRLITEHRTVMTTNATKRLKQITTAELIDVIEVSATIEQARESLNFATGSVFGITGKIEKLVKRENQLKFIITDKTDARREMLIFADMSADAKNVRLGKYHKGKTAQIVGKLVSFGYNGICINRCKLVTQLVTETQTKNSKKRRIETQNAKNNRNRTINYQQSATATISGL